MKKDIFKEQAHTLRKHGESINAISQKLSISKSTASIWCRDVLLTEQQIRTLTERSNRNATRALLKSAETKKIERFHTIAKMTQQGKLDTGTLTGRDIFMVGLGLYWGEGYKKGSQELGFTNSDPHIIRFYINWLSKIYLIKKVDLILRISINELHLHREREVLAYWSKLLNIPKTQFTKTSFIKTKSKKVYNSSTKHYGTLRVKVRRGTNLRRKILGSISALYIK